jgi:recombinational DNA repair protein RecR
MTIDEDKIAALEQAGLLKGRYYIVLEPLEDEDGDEDGFAIRAYATKDTQVEIDGTTSYDPTYVILQGLLGAVHENFDDLYDMGLERVTLEALGEVVPEEELKPEHRDRIKSMEGNVITAKFGELQ